MKECKLEYAYLVKSDRGYYCQESHLFENMREVATRIFSGRAARRLAEQIQGQIEREDLTPMVLRAIIEEKKQGPLTGSFIRKVLSRICILPDKTYEYEAPTLGGRHTEDCGKVLFTGVCRYADIYHTAHSLIMSYYNFMSSMEYYEYDPELDGRGMEELEIVMQIQSMFEQQISNLALLEYDAREYLWAAFSAGSPKASGRFCAVLDLFSEKIIKEYEPDPEKCYKQYADIAATHL